MSTKLQPHKTAVTWEGGDNAERVMDCVRMLHVHGFLSEAERDRAVRRVQKWYAATAPRGGKGGA